VHGWVASGTKKSRLSPFRSDFSDTSTVNSPLLSRLVSPPCHAYPSGSGKASIRRSMLPNRRRVRWLSAKRPGRNQVCLGSTMERRGEESAASALPEAAANVCLDKFSLK